ncbi:Mu transposase C-terminal domain-containing protein [Massilia sp. YIM B02769]|jgi:hypothetical protein|uniref:Mu transposase C-terminal domain-containing protein n=1 Tax=Massilia sp. YIM B02769 TaxID=3050129 RepID=UPI0025B6BB0C|nr:Mu transposase C-terminal domain-containing protein [Massilia sp. YIM B02769]MDN4059217.1 Mu transposase C-terminal domain-containing protein [Massilia sp. YIM B02769]
MKNLSYGKLRFDRASIPDFLADLQTWPSVDPSALREEDRAPFRARCDAIKDFIEEKHVPVNAILKNTGVSRSTLYRLIEKCWQKHADGRIYGFRAVIPYERLADYERQQRVDGEREGYSGCAGAFAQLLREHPPIEKLLLKRAVERVRPIKGQKRARQVRKPLRAIHDEFIRACRAEKIKSNEYPFTEQRQGFRTMQTYLRKMSAKKYPNAATDAGGQRTGAAPGDEEQAPAATRPFQVIEFDGHKLDLRLTIRLKDPLGFERTLELHRIWILVLLDVQSRAVLGYSLAFGKEYNKDDVAAALQSALTPFVPRKYTIPDLEIDEGGGFPSAVFPVTAYACWDWFRFDGAKSHLAAATLERLTQIVGCWTENGPAGEPDARPFIERFFQLLSRHFAHRFPGTLGNDPESIEKALGDPGGDISLLIEYEELEQLIEVVIANYNGSGHGGLLGVTPLAAMRHWLRRKPCYLRSLPRFLRSSLCLLQEARVVPVKGSLKTGVRPHINFSNVRYTSKELAGNAGLINKKIRIYYDVRDIRTVKAFFEDGTELGILTAARPWNATPHSLRLRQQIFREIEEGKLVVKDGMDPIEAWERKRWSEARTSKRAANALAQAHVNGRQVMPAAEPNPAEHPEGPDSPEGEGSTAPLAPAATEDSPTATPATEAPLVPVPEPAPPDEVPTAQPRVLKIRRIVTF